MEHKSTLNLPLLSRGMMAVLTAQFLSALADNAALIAAIAIVKTQGLASLVPMLQDSFVVPFILLAPFAGQLADAFPKGRVMLLSNLVKLCGALAMALGANPLAAYGLIGIGATLYSPAKYGILAQMFGPAVLVRANGMMEGSTIVAILTGVLLGGWLADHSLTWAFAGVMIAYALAALANLFIPRVATENPGAEFHPWRLVLKFRAALALLFRHPDARFSLLGTSIFWGSGITLRLMLFAWVPAALLITDNQTPANLMGAVSIGIVAGAGAAGLWITLASVNRALIGGLLLGPVVLALSLAHSFVSAAMVMVAIGACGGLFVVPLNALLQERGHKTIGAGNALAVQNFAENCSMLIFVSLYGVAIKAGVPVAAVSIGFGLLLLLVIGGLAFSRMRRG
ncbi:MAG TPA: lysophospholipid transporter LplT [Gallionellaceae bacterium]